VHRPKSWSTPFPQERLFWDGLDPDYLFDFASRLSSIGTYELGFRPSGTQAAHRVSDLILKEMHSLGLEEVRREPFPVYAWDFAGASLELDGWEPLTASSYPPTPGTPNEGLCVPLVEAGHGTARDYLDIDVQDKIAFVRFDTERLPWMDVLAHEAELHGACALVFYYLNGYAQHESGEALNTHDGAARPTIPILQLPKRDGARVAERLVAEGPVLTTLRSQVEIDPQGTGHNVIGHIPGRLTDRYLIIGAHYDAWFHGYWDNAVGVAGILTLAKALLENGYQPEHTLLFIATDAEEFGAPDTHFDWLIGCHRLLEAHPEWHARVSAAFNIDTLSFLTQEELGFIGPPELVPFLQEAVGGYQAKTFPQPRVWVKEQVTAWTETLTYAYFGVPPLQPRFGAEEIKRTIYHTQFDTAEMVHHERAVETLQLYGALLVRFDGQPILPYDFTQRVQTLRATIQNPPSGLNGAVDEELGGLGQALDELEAKARRWNSLSDETEAGESLQDLLRQVAAHLISNINYVDATAPEDALPMHVFYDRDLRAFDAALDHLASGHAQAAMAALTDDKTGLHGARFALNMSYPVYYRNTLAGRNPGRNDLYWGQDRTPMIPDVWGELHTLQDKLARGMIDFGAEMYALCEKRETVAAAYRDALRQLTGVINEAADMLLRNT
jgi:Iap family predicted aminopeptidase